MGRPSSSLSSKTWRDAPQWESVERFVENVRPLNPRLVLLFGSLAKGDFTQHSDADVLVVLEQPVDWETVYRCSDGVVQPVVVTWEEAIARIEEGEPFFHEILTEGEVLIDRGGAFRQLRQRSAIAARKRGLERTPYGWRWREQR